MISQLSIQVMSSSRIARADRLTLNLIVEKYKIIQFIGKQNAINLKLEILFSAEKVMRCEGSFQFMY